MVVGAWVRRRSPDFAPFFVYAAILFAFSALVSAVHVPNGTFIHSAVALAPQATIIALEGVVAAVVWASARRSWDVASASRVFLVAVVGLAMFVGVSFSFVTRSAWIAERDLKLGAGGRPRRRRRRATDVVMSLDTGGVKYWTGHPGVVAPADPIGTIQAVAQAYGARWLLVERRDSVGGARAPAQRDRGASRSGSGRASGASPRAISQPAPTRPARTPPCSRSASTRPTRGATHDGARGVADGRVPVRRGRRGPGDLRLDPALSDARGHGLLRGGSAQPARRARPGQRRDLELPDAAAGLPATGVRGLAAAADACSHCPAMAVLGHTFDAAKVPAVLVGSLIPVLAWRLAADVAEERGFARGRARTLAIGTGLTAVVYLPARPVRRAARLDDAVRHARSCRQPADDPDPAPTARGRSGSARSDACSGLGVVLGLAALTRNEAAWLALTWAGLAWWSGPRGQRIVLVAVPAVVALVIFAPVGDPRLGGLRQSIAGPGAGQRPVDPWLRHLRLERSADAGALPRGRAGPTCSRCGSRGSGTTCVNVLVGPGFPVALIGLVALPWTGRAFALRPLVVVSVVTFLVTSLLFPVATTWGTFLHAAGAAHVLLIISALLGARRTASPGSARSAAGPGRWPGSGPTLTIASGLLFSVAFGSVSTPTRRPMSPAATSSWPSGWRPSDDRSMPRPDRWSPTSRSGSPRPDGSRPWRCPTSRRRMSSTWPRRSPGPATW